jgi:hypothetical protein
MAPDVHTTVHRYIAVWNETDPARRRALIDLTWSEDASYVDPHFAGEGRDGIDAVVAGVQESFPGLRFELTDGPDAHHDRVRFAWRALGPNGNGPAAVGVDFATVAPDGRLRSVTGFLEPAA